MHQLSRAAHHKLVGFLVYHEAIGEGIDCLRKATERNPNFAQARFSLQNALEAAGRIDETTACYKKEIELNPQSAIAHSSLGSLLLKHKKQDEAIACYRKAIE